MGCTAGGVAKSMFCIKLDASRPWEPDADASDSSFSASGDEMLGAWLLVEVTVDASLTLRTGNRPLLPTVTCLTLPALRKELLGARPAPWPGIITCSVFTLPLVS